MSNYKKVEKKKNLIFAYRSVLVCSQESVWSTYRNMLIQSLTKQFDLESVH